MFELIDIEIEPTRIDNMAIVKLTLADTDRNTVITIKRNTWFSTLIKVRDTTDIFLKGKGR